MSKISFNIQGVGFPFLGMLIFSLQDIAVKWIGGDYPVLEIVTFRSLMDVFPEAAPADPKEPISFYENPFARR